METLSALAAYKLSHFFESRRDENWFREHPELPSLIDLKEVYSELSDEPDELYSNLIEADENNCYEQYKKIWIYTQGNKLVSTMLQLAVLYYMNPAYSLLFAEICNGCKMGPTLELATKVLLDTDSSFEGYRMAMVSWSYLKYIFPAYTDTEDFYHTPLVLDSRILAFFHSIDCVDDKLLSFAKYYRPSVDRCDKRFAVEADNSIKLSMDEVLDKAGRYSIQIGGRAKSGRKLLAKYKAAELGLDLLMVDFDLLCQTEKDFKCNWKHILRELFFEPACLCLYHINHKEDENGNNDIINIIREMEREYLAFGKPVFYLTDDKVKLVPFVESEVKYYCIKPYSSSECLMMWNWFLDEYGLSELIDANRLAGVMNLPAGQVRQICRMCAEKVENGTYKTNDEFRICYQVLDDGRYENVRVVTEKYNWNDLKLEEIQKVQLEKICNQVSFRSKIMNEWDLEKNYKYGKSISAIFTGPPGTGKTMAAGVLANRLGLELYKIDLSQIVDKYIGETEKRLEEVFERAEKSHMVLFFDEADAILGKRSEVKDAKDKYANTEVSYLLQRMEEYDGIVLMATNNRSNIDTAFIRRFRFEVPFSQPNAKRRKEIWEMLLTDKIPCADIDIDYMSETFEITGAIIKNIVLNACFDAIAEKGVLTMEILIMATVRELQKNGKVVIPADLKQYEYLLND